MINSISAGIILYNPDNINRVRDCIEAVRKQVKQIYVFDNGTNLDSVFPYGLGDRIEYLTEKENKGVAYALNRIIEKAVADGYRWVLTLDEDSIIPEGMIEDFSRYLGIDNKLAVVCPQVIDKRRAYMSVDRNKGTEYLNMCITSATCLSTAAWASVGKFDEWLFIDLVDNEFCKRLIESGYKILQIKKWVLDQEFGNIVPKSKKSQVFWIKASKLFHNRNIAKLSYKKIVSPQRVYYTCRNIIYVNRKLKRYGKTAYENYNCKGYLGFLISFVAPSILRADRKINVLKAAVTGTCDGLRKHVVPWIENS